jgi:formate dehydrogenase maturation protein FdhE
MNLRRLAGKGIVPCLKLLQGARRKVDISSMESTTRRSEVEMCPSCGSAMLVLRGRVRRGETIRDVICRACKNTWQLDRPPFAARLRP